jgi:hypothetical protein
MHLSQGNIERCFLWLIAKICNYTVQNVAIEIDVSKYVRGVVKLTIYFNLYFQFSNILYTSKGFNTCCQGLLRNTSKLYRHFSDYI